MMVRLSVLIVGLSLVVPLAARAWDARTIHIFSQYKDGDQPLNAGVIAGDSGELYGTTAYGLGGCGSFYKLSPAARKWRSKVLWVFRGGSKDGCNPMGHLIRDPNGSFYGVTEAGGTHGAGTAYRLVPEVVGDKTKWKEEILWNFGKGADGAGPIAGLLFANGTDATAGVYGTSRDGGDGLGTVFEIMPPPAGQKHWSESVLYRFQGGQDGSHPWGGVIEDADGSLFGTTYEGGYRISTHPDNGAGTVYKLTPPGAGETAWTENLIHTFTGNEDGGHPEWVDLIADRNMGQISVLYGTASEGGAGINPLGVVFQLTPQVGSASWTSATLWTFQYDSELSLPIPGAGLAFVNGSDSTDGFFGTTWGGACFGLGSNLFELVPNGDRSEWNITQSWNFGNYDACALAAPTVVNGTVYGTTDYVLGVGSVYEVQSAGSTPSSRKRNRRK
jgi:hypothetical protein